MSTPRKRTLAQWQAAKTPSPPPEPTYTEAEFEAIKARGQPPFYQLKAEFPDVTKTDGLNHGFLIEGQRFVRSFYDGIDRYGNCVISLTPQMDGEDSLPRHDGRPNVRDRAGFERAMAWIKTEWPAIRERRDREDAQWRTRKRLGFLGEVAHEWGLI